MTLGCILAGVVLAGQVRCAGLSICIFPSGHLAGLCPHQAQQLVPFITYTTQSSLQMMSQALSPPSAQ